MTRKRWNRGDLEWREGEERHGGEPRSTSSEAELCEPVCRLTQEVRSCVREEEMLPQRICLLDARIAPYACDSLCELSRESLGCSRRVRREWIRRGE